MSHKFPAPIPRPFHWLWKSCCQQKHITFFWLLLYDILNTRDMLQRKQIFIVDYTCVLCNSGSLETRDRLFFNCQFAQVCWKYLCPMMVFHHGLSHLDYIEQLKEQIQKPFFMEIIILCSRALWLTRNDFIFNGKELDLYRCRAIFKYNLKWLKHRAARKKYGMYADWVDCFI